MEVSYSSPKLSNVRPDGLIACKRGSTTWGAFVEAKAEGKPIRPEQIQDYASLAAALDMQALITVSTEFALSPSELPYHVAVNKRRQREIYHFAWADIRTFLEGLVRDGRWGVTLDAPFCGLVIRMNGQALFTKWICFSSFRGRSGITNETWTIIAHATLEP